MSPAVRCGCSVCVALCHVAWCGLDALQVHRSLPRPSSRVTALRFHPEDDTLAIACRDNHFWLYDGRTGMLRDWSREFGSRCVCLRGARRLPPLPVLTCDCMELPLRFLACVHACVCVWVGGSLVAHGPAWCVCVGVPAVSAQASSGLPRACAG